MINRPVSLLRKVAIAALACLPLDGLAQDSDLLVFTTELETPDRLVIVYDITVLETYVSGGALTYPSGLVNATLKLTLPDGSEVALGSGLERISGLHEIEDPDPGQYRATVERFYNSGETLKSDIWSGGNLPNWGILWQTGNRIVGTVKRKSIEVAGFPVDRIDVAVESNFTLTLTDVHLSEDLFAPDSTLTGDGTVILEACSIGPGTKLYSAVQALELHDCLVEGTLTVQSGQSLSVFDSEFLKAGVSLRSQNIYYEGNRLVGGIINFTVQEAGDIVANDFFPYVPTGGVRYVEIDGGRVSVTDPNGVANITGNVFAGWLDLTLDNVDDGTELAITRNSFLDRVQVFRASGNPVGMVLPLNFWGSWRGPWGEEDLPETWPFLARDVPFLKEGLEEVCANSSLPVPSPILRQYGLLAGQHVVGIANPYLRRGRDVLVAARIQPVWGSIPPAQFRLHTNQGQFSPRNPSTPLRRDYGKPPAKAKPSQFGYLEFIVPAPASGPLEGSLILTRDGVETEIDTFSEDFHPGPARPLRIGVAPTRVVGYERKFFQPKAGRLAKAAIRRWISTTLPLRPDEIEVEVMKPDDYFFGYTALAAVLNRTAMLNELTVGFHRKLAAFNSKRPDAPLDFLVVLLPKGTLGTRVFGASLPLRRSVILLDEISPDSIVHELGHALGLYTTREQYSPLTEGYGYNGYFYVKGKGIRVEDQLAFTPDYGIGHPEVPGRSRMFPRGVDSGVYDVMGGDAPQWIIRDTFLGMSQGLFGLLGSAGSSLKTPTPPGAYKAIETTASPSRRILAQGLFAFDGQGFHLLLPSVSFAVAPADYGPIRQPRSTSFTFRAYDGNGTVVATDLVTMGTGGPLTDWIQTFEVPVSAVRFEIHDSATNPRTYHVFEPMDSLSINLAAQADPDLPDQINLSWESDYSSLSGRSPAVLLQVSTDAGANWDTFSTAAVSGSVVVPPESFSSGGSRWFRALASDGFQIVESPGTPPLAQPSAELPHGFAIEMPVNGASAPASAAWQFSAATINPSAQPVSVEWVSSLDGSLGHGLPFFPADPLSPGTHSLTARAHLPSGEWVEDSVIIEVTETAVPDLSLSQAVLDLRADGIEPSFGRVPHPQAGSSSSLVLDFPSPGVTGTLRLLVRALAPDASTRILLDEAFPTQPLGAIRAVSSLETDLVGDWEIEASVEWIAASADEIPPVDPQPDNNHRVWQFPNHPSEARSGQLILSAGQTAPLQLAGYDPDGDPLMYQITAGPGLGTLDGQAPDFSYTAPQASGETTIGFTVTDGLHAPASGEFKVIVRPTPPVITSPGSFETVQYQDAHYQISATQAPDQFGSLNLHIPGSPWQGLQLDSATGLISGQAVRFGEDVLFVTAANALGRAEMAVSVKVAESVLRPLITSAAVATGQAGTPFSYQLEVANQPESITLHDLPEGLSFQAYSRLLTGEPTRSGRYTVRVVAANAHGSSSFDLSLIIAPPERLPYLPPQSSFFGQAGQHFSAQINGLYDAFAYTATQLPVGLSLDPQTGVLSGTPLESGLFWGTVTARNLAGLSSAELIITIEALAGAPVLSGPSDYAVGYAEPADYAIAASGNPTEFWAEGLPAGIALNPVTGHLSGSSTQPGTYPVILYARNEAGTGAQRLSLTVYQNFNFPYFSNAAHETVTEGQAVDLQLWVNGDPQTVEASGLPDGLSLQPETRRITGTARRAGIFPIELSASNAAGTGSFTLNLHILPDLDAWMSIHALTQSHADPDLDGLPNVLEFLLGCDPHTSDSPEGMRSFLRDGHPWLRLRLPPGGTGPLLSGYTAGGATFRMESAPGLGEAWGSSLLGLDGAAVLSTSQQGWVIVEIPLLAPPDGRAFWFRLLGLPAE